MQIKFFKREKVFKKKSPEINLYAYWDFIFIAGFLLTLVAFTFGFYLYKETKKESVLSTIDSSRGAQIVNKERIDKVLEYFSLREQKSNQILNSPTPVVDPSL